MWDIVTFILEQEGIDMNEGNVKNNTPLYFATKNGHENIVL